MKHVGRGVLTGGLLLWPMLAFADDQEVKYTLLFVGGIGGILVGAGLYALLMVLAAAFLKYKALLAAAFAVCIAIFLFSQYTSIQTLRVALGLWQSQGASSKPAEFTIWLLLLLIGLMVFAVVIFRFSVRLWKKRQRQRMILRENEKTRMQR